MAKPLHGIILDTVTLEWEEFFSFDPPQKTRGVVYDEVPVRGRSEPHVFYSYTEASVWQFMIHLNANVDQADTGTPRDVKEKERFIESLIMPDYRDSPGDFNSVVKPPHLARISILSMFDAFGTIRGLSFNYMAPYDIITGYPHQIDCSFSFHVQKEIGKQVEGYADVRRRLIYGQDRQ